MEYSLDNIDEFAHELYENLRDKNIVVLLQGDLASGKTTLVQRFIRQLNDNHVVTSPTFQVQSIYGDKFYHYDIYNKDLSEFIRMGLLEEFEKPGIHFVEWGDKDLENILKEYGFEYMTIQIIKKKHSREYIIGS